MRPISVKGEQYVFRWRFLGLFKAWQPRLRHLDFQVRYSPAEVAKLDGPSTGGNFGRYPTRIRTCLPTFARLQDPTEQATYAEQQFREWNRRREDAQMRSFPLNDNLRSLLFLVQSDLNEHQRDHKDPVEFL